MAKKVWIVMLAFLLVLAFGCAGTRGKVVSSYELAGTILKAAYDVAKPACDTGTLSAEDCAKIKDCYNQARQYYIIAGDVLILALETEEITQKQADLEEYQKLVNLYTESMSKMLKMLVDLGVIEEGDK